MKDTSIEIELSEIVRRSPPTELTEREKNLLAKQLEDSLVSKIKDGTLEFSSSNTQKENEILSERAGPRPVPIDLSRYGLHNPGDIKVFLLSPAGETVRQKITAKILSEEFNKKEQLLKIQEDLLERERIRALLFHWLLTDEEDSKKAQEEIVQQQQVQVLKEKEPTSKSEKSSDTGYTSTLTNLYETKKNLSAREKRLKNESKLLDDKFQTYKENLDAFDSKADRYIKKTVGELEEEIQRLREEDEKLVIEISTTGDEQEAYALGDKLRTVHFEIESLNDIIAVKQDRKIFVGADGENLNINSADFSYDKAAFVLPKGQKIEKENGQYYLMNEELSLSTMSDDKRKIAQQKYELNKNDIRVVKKVALDVTQQEIDLNKKRTRENKAEQLMVQKQIELVLQAHKSTLKRSKSLSEQIPLSPPASTHAMPTKPSLSPQVPSPPPPPITTWESLFIFVKTLPPAPRNEAEKFLKKDPELIKLVKKEPKQLHEMTIDELIAHFKRVFECPPVPKETMRVFIENMPRFEAAQDKPNVTPLKGPITQQQEQAEEPSPSSEITTRTL